jgi:hypothetical protein
MSNRKPLTETSTNAPTYTAVKAAEMSTDDFNEIDQALEPLETIPEKKFRKGSTFLRRLKKALKKKPPWLWSASELCRPSDRRFLAK